MRIGIEIYDSFFEPHLHAELATFIRHRRWQYGWHSNSSIEYTQFHAEFGHGGSHNREDVYDKVDPLLQRAWDFVKVKAIRGSHSLLRCYANLNVYGTEGFPHRDTEKENKTDVTCIAYFCGPEWKLEWCGETALVREGEIIKSVLPKENRLFMFPSYMTHIARSVTRVCPLPRITLIFKSSPIAAT